MASTEKLPIPGVTTDSADIHVVVSNGIKAKELACDEVDIQHNDIIYDRDGPHHKYIVIKTICLVFTWITLVSVFYLFNICAKTALPRVH